MGSRINGYGHKHSMDNVLRKPSLLTDLLLISVLLIVEDVLRIDALVFGLERRANLGLSRG